MKVYRIHEMAEKLGVSIKTLQRWDNTGKLPARRTPSNQRYYTEDQYLDYIGLSVEKPHRKAVAYARVSSRNQKDDLKHQIDFIRTFANARGVILDECIEDIGSGLNYNRKKWNDLLNDCINQKIQTIIISNKDRFIRFGYDWFEQFLLNYGVNIIVVSNDKLSPNEELIQDLISIIHIFSCRIYGLRKYKKKIKNDEEL